MPADDRRVFPRIAEQFVRERLEERLPGQVFVPIALVVRAHQAEAGHQWRAVRSVRVQRGEEFRFLLCAHLAFVVTECLRQHVHHAAAFRPVAENGPEQILVLMENVLDIPSVPIGGDVAQQSHLVLAIGHQQKLVVRLELHERAHVVVQLPEAGERVKLGEEMLGDAQVVQPGLILHRQIAESGKYRLSQEARSLVRQG